MAVLPRGVSSNFRDWGPTESPVVARGEGCHLWDLDGNRFIDYRLGYGPVILGHGHPAVCDRVAQAIRQGTLFAALTEGEVRLAERIRDLCPGVELVRYANSGTEATMHALRIARGYTGREKIVKFEGQYHGMHDYVLWSTATATPTELGARRSPIPVQASSGIPAAIRQTILTLPFNDAETLELTLRREGHQIAALIVEPILGNAASIMPQQGWLALLRQKCDEYGIVLIFDEVKTGFRIAPGGAQELFGVAADLVTYAKSIANGFPLAAVGGKREIMRVIAAGVAHGGTYCGTPTAIAAGEATLELLADGQILRAIDAQGIKLQAGISQILTQAGIPHHLLGPGAMFGLVLMQDPPQDYRDLARHDSELYDRIALELNHRGVAVETDAREPWFLCAAHDDSAIDETLNILEDAVRSAIA